MDVIIAHQTEILAILLIISELLASITEIKANSVFQLIVGFIKKLAGK
jgi:hypothetical protein